MLLKCISLMFSLSVFRRKLASAYGSLVFDPVKQVFNILYKQYYKWLEHYMFCIWHVRRKEFQAKSKPE